MTDSGKDAGGDSEGWFYCLKHKKVEQGMVCPARNRLGPYPTEAEAARALEISRERNEAWDNDPRWK
ncbi:hypothetical protein [Streptacidiphilus sp. P02-A3a]|uniref:hypothetical protein n=1 Tax=Streptacidiphilus sp. P02-A3a TaxID=2704468 RepID=UPI0015FB8018|nr:hypothetical protein [Streptacidiphilus sp. P02-A3a]QMU68396.1 hypothetical protein GXP74_09325 [Streptacidiphilus sp. P02-A3a]